MSLKTWQWGIIGLAISLVIIINIIVLWVLVTRKRRNREAKDKAESSTIQDISSANSRQEDEEEGTVIMNDTNVQEIKKEEAELYGQQYALVTSAQTVLSPPPSSQLQQPKKYNNTLLESLPEQDNVTPISATSLVAERFLSLSPFRPHKNQSPQSVYTESPPPSTLDSRQTSSTHFQGSVNGSIWRGPTPPWTQYPGRNRS